MVTIINCYILKPITKVLIHICVIFIFIFKPLTKQNKQNQPHRCAEMTTVKV